MASLRLGCPGLAGFQSFMPPRKHGLQLLEKGHKSRSQFYLMSLYCPSQAEGTKCISNVDK